MNKILWVVSAKDLPEFLQAKAEAKFDYTAQTDADMTEYGWIRVGVAEIFPEYQQTDEIRRLALQECEKAIEKVSKEFTEKINVLRTFRSELLCLEAPKAGQDFSGDYGDTEFLA